MFKKIIFSSMLVMLSFGYTESIAKETLKEIKEILGEIQETLGEILGIKTQKNASGTQKAPSETRNDYCRAVVIGILKDEREIRKLELSNLDPEKKAEKIRLLRSNLAIGKMFGEKLNCPEKSYPEIWKK